MIDGGIPIGRGSSLEGEGQTVARVTLPVCRLIIMVRAIITMIMAGVSFTIGLLIVMMKIVTLAMVILTAHHLRWVRVG